jgi:hypothetical protein
LSLLQSIACKAQVATLLINTSEGVGKPNPAK